MRDFAPADDDAWIAADEMTTRQAGSFVAAVEAIDQRRRSVSPH